MSHSDPPADDSNEDSAAWQGQVRHNNLSARLPEHVGTGVFSNGVMILTGPFEVVCDFVLRMGEQQRIVARVIMPRIVAQQFGAALRENIDNYERRFGPLPKVPRPQPEAADEESGGIQEPGTAAPADREDSTNRTANSSQIDDIYDELRIPDELLSGRYANAVLIRHSGTEFCFDFITNVYPRSAISARVYLAAPHAGPFLASLRKSVGLP
jgi:hypothetical protein